MFKKEANRIEVLQNIEEFILKLRSGPMRYAYNDVC
jgi:hypothetical protein